MINLNKTRGHTKFLLLAGAFMLGCFLVLRFCYYTVPDSPLFNGLCTNELRYYTPPTLHEQYDEAVIRMHPNLPSFLTTANKLSSFIPDITSIRWNGGIYQESWVESSKFLLYSAHFDARTHGELDVRLLALYTGDRRLPSQPNFFCQMWHSVSEKPIMSPVFEAYIIDHEHYSDEHLNPYLISCKVPSLLIKHGRIPIAVSLVKAPCQTPSNVLHIAGSPTQKKLIPSSDSENITVGVCGKALFYYNDDPSMLIIEWIEFMKALGVSQIFFYKMDCHENVEKVLRYYESEGIVKLISFQYPPPYVQDATFLRLWTRSKKAAYRCSQTIYLNDCFLRNKDDFDYLAVFDIDEVPVLKKQKTLAEFIKQRRENIFRTKLRSSFKIKWKVHYPDFSPGSLASNIPSHFHMLRHNKRTMLNVTEALVLETSVKSIYDTSKVLLVGIHEVIRGIRSGIKPIEVDRRDAYIAHFRSVACHFYCEDRNIEDENTLLNYREEVIMGANETLSRLQLNFN